MRRPIAGEYGDFYQGYIDRTRGSNFLQNLEDSGAMLLELLHNLPEDQRDYAYAPGKWTISEMLQHIVDCDTVFTYRALWIARNNGGVLPAFDENKWAESAKDMKFFWDETLEQFRNLRNFSIGFFHSLADDALELTGTLAGHDTKVNSIPFILAGHTYHHIHILKDRYLK